jgi:hypothetical protein
MRTGILLITAIILALSIATTRAADPLPPAGEVTLELTGFAAGVGVSWGKGVLLFKGKKYPFEIEGLSVGDVGFARVSAKGPVYNLKHSRDFSGTYAAVGAGVAVAGGMAGLTMRNEHGVIIDLYAMQEGIKLNIGPQGLTITLR